MPVTSHRNLPCQMSSIDFRISPPVILVTGPNCSGKDYCVNVWASSINAIADKTITARVASISDATKRAYAKAIRSDLDRLLRDRAYKEQHRVGLTDFYQRQVKWRPELPDEHLFVGSMVGVDVLLITGMRDEAPVAVFSRLVANTRLIEMNVEVDEEMWRARQGCSSDGCLGGDRQPEAGNPASSTAALDYTLLSNPSIAASEEAHDLTSPWFVPLAASGSLQKLESLD